MIFAGQSISCAANILYYILAKGDSLHSKMYLRKIPSCLEVSMTEILYYVIVTFVWLLYIIQLMSLKYFG